MQTKIKRGDMYYTDLIEGKGSEQKGRRPVLVIQNDIGNKYSSTVIVAIITSKIDGKPKLPTHHQIQAQQGLERNSLVLLEQIRTIDKSRLGEYIGTLDSIDMANINEALSISVGLAE